MSGTHKTLKRGCKGYTIPESINANRLTTQLCVDWFIGTLSVPFLKETQRLGLEKYAFRILINLFTYL